MPSHECVTAEEARTWWLRGSFLAPGRGAEYVVSSMRGGRAAAVTDVEAQPALMVVFGSRSNRVSTADVKQLVADGAVILTGRMVGRGAPPEEDVSGSERRIVVRGRPGVILSIAANAEREGIRLVTWFTQGSGGETISWSALDRPDFRSDAQLIALLNELTES